ncbi:hypothetical protein D1815_15345 [Aquimarina sp. AD1]|uniref:hypothetical protein n=1 Tax=Aquimarina sp. (strain AD1) TaxID=1714848 RepID=UPI000E527777|nr:hypothetical protein [Aquimarina sp. AD1]AXT57052.1 hypothetical protein D1815_15345 [Aquimarina sp. AD1]RKN26360.1 hypothetical protein D7035_09415 [Aquimarina sp. AD1]
MKKLFLLLLMVGAGLTTQAQKTWEQLGTEVFPDIYHVATELGKQTDKVVAKGSAISITTSKGTVTLEQRRDKTKPENIKHYEYFLLSSTGKEIPLRQMNAHRTLEKFQLKLLQLKESLAENQDKNVEELLDSLF